VRLQTWFFLIAFPLIGSLIVLLGGSVLITRERVQELGQAQRAGTSIADLERLIVALAAESREMAASLVPVSATGVKEAEETQDQFAAAQRLTDRAFATSMASLTLDHATGNKDHTASDPKALRVLIDRLRDAENYARELARDKRFAEANLALVETERLNENLLEGQLVKRFDLEQAELEQALNSLESTDLFNRVTLGSTRGRLDSLKGPLGELEDEMKLTLAFQLMLTRLNNRVAGLAEGDGRRHAELTVTTRAAVKKLIEVSHSGPSRLNLLALRPEMDEALFLADSVEDLLLSNQRAAASAMLSDPLDEFNDGTVFPRLDAVAEQQAIAFNSALQPLRMRASMLSGGLVIFTLIVLALGFGAPLMLSRFLSRPVAFLTRVAREIGSGNFETEVRRIGAGEIGELLASFFDLIT
jgi:HAMP domain-containing protein